MKYDIGSDESDATLRQQRNIFVFQKLYWRSPALKIDKQKPPYNSPQCMFRQCAAPAFSFTNALPNAQMFVCLVRLLFVCCFFSQPAPLAYTSVSQLPIHGVSSIVHYFFTILIGCKMGTIERRLDRARPGTCVGVSIYVFSFQYERQTLRNINGDFSIAVQVSNGRGRLHSLFTSWSCSFNALRLKATRSGYWVLTIK